MTFVDYGSRRETAERMARLVGTYPFCRYIYTDTRGRPFCRAEAMNLALRSSRARFFAAADVDLLFPPSFIAAALARADDDRFAYCFPLALPRGEAVVDATMELPGELPLARGSYGAFQLAPTAVLQRLRGYDEFYRFWGREDTDLHQRLRDVGLVEERLHEMCPVYHQWHPRVSIDDPASMPIGLWPRMCDHFARMTGVPVRNTDAWGKALTTGERPAVAIAAALARGSTTDPARVTVVRTAAAQARFLGALVTRFWSLSPNDALAIHHRAPPWWASAAASVVGRVGGASRVGLLLRRPHELLDASLVEFVERNAASIADYHFAMCSEYPYSVLVRA